MSRIDNLGSYGKVTTEAKQFGGMDKLLDNVRNHGFKQGAFTTGCFVLGAYSFIKTVSNLRENKRQEKEYYTKRKRAKQKAFIAQQQARIAQMAIELEEAKRNMNAIAENGTKKNV